MIAIIAISIQDAEVARRLEAGVQRSGEMWSCALGGGATVTWLSDGSYAGCIS
jgi:hypothetical protein